MDVDDATKIKIWQDMYKQAAWERDVAIKQLEQLRYEFSEKIDPDHFREVTKKTDEESISKQELLTSMRTLCDGCYLMEHCGQCNPDCRLRQAIDMIEESSSITMVSEKPSEDGESEINNSDEWWKNYIRSRMS